MIVPLLTPAAAEACNNDDDDRHLLLATSSAPVLFFDPGIKKEAVEPVAIVRHGHTFETLPDDHIGSLVCASERVAAVREEEPPRALLYHTPRSPTVHTR